MDVRHEATRTHGGADTNRILTELSAGVARDAAAGDLGNHRQLRRDLEHLRLALEAGRHQLRHVDELARPHALGERSHLPSSFRTARVPSTIAFNLLNATSRGRRTRPQSGVMIRRSGPITSSPRRMRSATKPGDSTSLVLTSMTPIATWNGTLNFLNSSRSSSPRRANSIETACTLASRIAGNRN